MRPTPFNLQLVLALLVSGCGMFSPVSITLKRTGDAPQATPVATQASTPTPDPSPAVVTESADLLAKYQALERSLSGPSLALVDQALNCVGTQLDAGQLRNRAAGGLLNSAGTILAQGDASAQETEVRGVASSMLAFCNLMAPLTPAQREATAGTLALWAEQNAPASLKTLMDTAVEKVSVAPGGGSLHDSTSFLTTVASQVSAGTLTEEKAREVLADWKTRAFAAPTFGGGNTLTSSPTLTELATVTVAADGQVQASTEGTGVYAVAANSCSATDGTFVLDAITGALTFTPAATLQMPKTCTIDLSHTVGSAALTAQLRITLGLSQATTPTLVIGAPSATTIGSGQSVSFPLTYSNTRKVNLGLARLTLNRTGDAACSAKVVSGGTTTTPTVTVSGCTGNGSLTLTVAGGAALNIANQPDTGAGPSAVVTVKNNRAPLAPTGVAIQEASPTTLNTLHCSASDNGDPDNDELTLIYGWFKNGDELAGETEASLTPDNFTEGDEVACSVSVSDGSLSSAEVQSAEVTIAGIPARLAFIADPRILVDACQPVSVGLFTPGNVLVANDGEALDVNVTDDSATVAFYSDAACTAPVTSVQVGAGATVGNLYLKGTALGAANLTADDVGDRVASATAAVSFITGFTNVTVAAGLDLKFGRSRVGLLVEDVNRDGFLDFREGESLGLMFNNGNGTFTRYNPDCGSDPDICAPYGFYAYYFADYDGNGFIDILDGFSVWAWDGTHFRMKNHDALGLGACGGLAHDRTGTFLNLDGDHRLDIFQAYADSRSCVFSYAGGDNFNAFAYGVTTLQNHSNGARAVAADFDRDGVSELLASETSPDLHLYRIDPATKVFTKMDNAAIGLVHNNSGQAVTYEPFDFDNDGDLDLLVGKLNCTAECKIDLFRNDSTPGTLSFVSIGNAAGATLQTGGSTERLTSLDLELDGDLDVLINTSWDAAKQTIYLNRGNGTFRNYSSVFKFETTFWERDVNGIDYDNDGDWDILIGAEDNQPSVSLFRNDLDPQHFLRVLAVGSNTAGGSHWQAFGARVELLNAAGTQVLLGHEIMVGTARHNQKPTRLVFGLSPHWGGKHASYKVRVTFPSGTVRTVDVVPESASANVDGVVLGKTVRVLEAN